MTYSYFHYLGLGSLFPTSFFHGSVTLFPASCCLTPDSIQIGSRAEAIPTTTPKGLLNRVEGSVCVMTSESSDKLFGLCGIGAHPQSHRFTLVTTDCWCL